MCPMPQLKLAYGNILNISYIYIFVIKDSLQIWKLKRKGICGILKWINACVVCGLASPYFTYCFSLSVSLCLCLSLCLSLSLSLCLSLSLSLCLSVCLSVSLSLPVPPALHPTVPPVIQLPSNTADVSHRLSYGIPPSPKPLNPPQREPSQCWGVSSRALSTRWGLFCCVVREADTWLCCPAVERRQTTAGRGLLANAPHTTGDTSTERKIKWCCVSWWGIR